MITNNAVFPPYEPVCKPYAKQTEALELSKNEPFYALFMEMGTGKSKVVIDNFCQLFLDRQIDGVIITAPKSFYLNWIEEFKSHLPTTLPTRILFWDADLTDRQRQKLWNLLIPQDNMLDILLINVEALANEKGFWFAKEFARMHHNMMIVDESTCIKNAKAERTKAAIRIGQFCDYRRVLTGTPLTQGPLDLFGQIEFLKPGYLGFKSFSTFKDYHADIRVITLGNRRFEKIERYKNVEELQNKIKSISFRVLKSECLDLPDKIFMTHKIQWTPEQKRIYTEMKEEYMVSFSRDSMVSTTSVLSAMMKLHQINCGHVTDDSGNIVHIPNNRVKALMELVDLTPGKIIVWGKFKEDIRMITSALSKEYGEDSAVHYYGPTTVQERLLHLERFKRDPTCRFFVANETGSKSLTLVQAAYAIYYSYDHKLETWLQSQDRNHRIGQDRNVTYTTLMIPDSVDETIMKNLLRKRDISTEFLDWKDLLSK